MHFFGDNFSLSWYSLTVKTYPKNHGSGGSLEKFESSQSDKHMYNLTLYELLQLKEREIFLTFLQCSAYYGRLEC